MFPVHYWPRPDRWPSPSHCFIFRPSTCLPVVFCILLTRMCSVYAQVGLELALDRAVRTVERAPQAWRAAVRRGRPRTTAAKTALSRESRACRPRTLTSTYRWARSRRLAEPYSPRSKHMQSSELRRDLGGGLRCSQSGHFVLCARCELRMLERNASAETALFWGPQHTYSPPRPFKN